MWSVFYGDARIGDPRIDGLELIDKKLELALNQTGTFEFTMPPTNLHSGEIELLQKSREIRVDRDGETVFYGRAMSAEERFDKSVTYTCEGDRGYFNDAQLQPYETGEGGVPSTVAGYFNWLVNKYNGSMQAEHRFIVGMNQGDELDTGDFYRKSDSRASVWSEMKAAIVDSLGGYVRTRHDGTQRIVDLLASGDSVSGQRIQFGENLLDFTHSTNGTEYCTRVFATGGKPEDEEDAEPTDFTGLNAAISTAQAINQGSASDASYGSLRSAILTAQNVANNAVATQDQADRAEETLLDAVYRFQHADDEEEEQTVSDLNAAISAASAKTQGSKPDKVWEALQAAIETAQGVASMQSPTQSEIDKAISLLESASDTFDSAKNEGEEADDGPSEITLEALGNRALLIPYELVDGWVIDYQAERKYGVIEASHEWSDVTDEEKLLEEAVRWLSNVKVGDTLEMTALDLSVIDPDASPIRIGDFIRATSRPHGFDEYFICTKRTYDLDAPQNDTFVLGSQYDTLTEAQARKLAELNGSINTYVDYLGEVDELAQSKTRVYFGEELPTDFSDGDLWVTEGGILVAHDDGDEFDPNSWSTAEKLASAIQDDLDAYEEQANERLDQLDSDMDQTEADVRAMDDELEAARAVLDEDAESFSAAAARIAAAVDDAAAEIAAARGDAASLDAALDVISTAAQDAQTYAEGVAGDLADLETAVNNDIDALEQALDDAAAAFDEDAASFAAAAASIKSLADGASADATRATGVIDAIEQELGKADANIAAALKNTSDTAAQALTDAGNAQTYVEGVASTLNNAKAYYAESSTGATTAAKVATITPEDSGWTLAEGRVVIVRFSKKLDVNSPTLNVNGTGAKAIKDVDGNSLTKTGAAAWAAGEAVPFVYDGTNWVAKTSAYQLYSNTRFEQTDEAITLSAVKSLVNDGANLSPFFEADWPASGSSTDYWGSLTTSRITQLTDGWAHVELLNASGSDVMYAYFVTNKIESIDTSKSLTMLVEIKNFNRTSGSGDPWVYANPATSGSSVAQYGAAGSNSFGGNTEIRRKLTATGNSDPTRLARTFFAVAAGTSVKFDARVSVYYDGEDAGGNRIGYTGPWKPYSGGIVYSTHAELTVTASEIESSVKSYFEDSSTGVLRNYVSSTTVNQTDSAILSAAQTAAQTYTDALGNELKATYATSSTGASTQAKTASCSNFKLYDGVQVAVKFTNGNTHATPTLNVNSKGAKSIVGEDGTAVGSGAWAAGETVLFVYDGTNWVMQGSVGKRTYATKTAINQTNDMIEAIASMEDTYTDPSGQTQTNEIKSTVTQTAAAIETRFHDFLASGTNMLLDTDVNTINAVNAPYPRGRDTRTGVTVEFITMQNSPVKGLTYAHRWQITADAASGWMNYAFYNRISGENSEQHGFKLTAGEKYTMGCWVYANYASRAKARLYLYSNTDDGDSASATCISYEWTVKYGWNFVRASGECPETRNYRAIFQVNPQGSAVNVSMCGFVLMEGVPSGEYDTLIRETSAGIEVGKVDASGSYVQAHSLVGTDGFHVIGSNGSTEYGFFTSSGARVGLASGLHVDTDGSGIGMYSGSTLLGLWNGTAIQLGRTNTAHIVLGAVTIDGSSVTGIHLRGYSGSAERENATITSTQITLGRLDHGHLITNANGLYIYDENSTAKASFTSSGAQIGADNSKNVLVTSDGVQLRDYANNASVVTGQFAVSGIQLGISNSDHLKLTSSSLAWYKGDFGNVTEGASNRFLYLATGTNDVVESGTTYTYANSAFRIGCRYRAKYNGSTFVDYSSDGANIVMNASDNEPALYMRIGDTSYTTISATKARIGRHANGYFNIVVDASTNGAGLFFNKSTGTGATAFTTLASFTDSAITMGAASGLHSEIKSDGFYVVNNTTVRSVFKAYGTRIGYVGGHHVIIGAFDASNADHINASNTNGGMYVMNDSTLLSSFTGTAITIGKTSGTNVKHIVLKSTGLFIYGETPSNSSDGTANCEASFTSDGVQVGLTSSKNILVTSDGVQMRDYVDNNSVIASQFGASASRIGLENGYNIQLSASTNSGSFAILNNTASLFSVSNSTMRLGQTTQRHLVLSSTSLCFYEAYGTGATYDDLTSDGVYNRMLYMGGDGIVIGNAYKRTGSGSGATYTNDAMNVYMTASQIAFRAGRQSDAVVYTKITPTAVQVGTTGTSSDKKPNVIIGTNDNSAGMFIRSYTTVLASFTDSLIKLSDLKIIGDAYSNSIVSESGKGIGITASNLRTVGFEQEPFTDAQLWFHLSGTTGRMHGYVGQTNPYSVNAQVIFNQYGTLEFLSNGMSGPLADWVIDDYTSTSSGYGTTANTNTVHWRKWASGRLECVRTWFGSRTVKTSYTPATGVQFYTTASAQQSFNWNDTQGNTGSYYGFVAVDSFTVDVAPADGTGLVWAEAYEWATTNSRNNITGGKAYIFSLYQIEAKNYYVTQKITGRWK